MHSAGALESWIAPKTVVCAWITALALAIGIGGISTPALAAETAVEKSPVGTTISVRRRVTGILAEDKRRLRKGTRVHRNEVLLTEKKGRAELKLDDDTKLAVGPGARIRLDEFVLGENKKNTSVVVSLLAGTFRFITGLTNSESYRIETPVATIGVRGTVFDVYVSPQGETLVLLHEGEVEICTRTFSCRRHTRRGWIMHTSVAGVLSAPIKFTAGLIPGLTAARAFPFVGRRLVIDPVRRLRRADIIQRSVTQPVKRTGRTIRRGTRKIRRQIRKLNPLR
ncbi:MAG: FecR family protein [Hyphomicrobiaceae bacterium]